MPNAVEPGWYYLADNKKMGPVSVAQLKELAARSQLRTTDLICRQDVQQWQPLWRVPEFASVTAGASSSTAAAPKSIEPATFTEATTRPPGNALAPINSTAQEFPELGPRYRFEKVLGAGGMATVYLAHDQQMARRVAIKVPHYGPKEKQLKVRFLQEVRTAAKLRPHSHICPVYDFGEVNNLCYMTMAYLDGRPLSALIRAGETKDQLQAARLIKTLAEALQDAHNQGVIHRDLKPANIMMARRQDKDGRLLYAPIITDFGLARQLEENNDRPTQDNQILGTPAYMAPEQCHGARNVGRSCDIYSLGVVFYEMLAGSLPFKGNSLALIQRIPREAPPPPSQKRADVDKRLEAICLKALAKKPEDRFATMADFARALEECLRPAFPLATPVDLSAIVVGDTDVVSPSVADPSLQTPRGGVKRRLLQALALMVLLATLAAGYAGYTVLNSTTNPSAAQASTQKGSAAPETTPAVANASSPALSAMSKLALVGKPVPLKGLSSWTLETTGHRGPIRAQVFSPDSKQLATGGLDGTVRIWNHATGQLIQAFVGHDGAITSLSWSSGGLLATGSSDKSVRIWEPNSGKVVRTIAKHEQAVTAVAWSADGQRLATASLDKTVRLWKQDSGEELLCHRDHETEVTAVAWSHDGALLASGDRNGVVLVWEGHSGQRKERLNQQSKTITFLAWSPVTTDALASASLDCSYMIWNFKMGKWRSVTFDDPVLCVAWSPDGLSLASARGLGVGILVPNAGVGQIQLKSGHLDAVTALAWSPDGKTIASGCGDSHIRLWEPSTGQLRRIIRGQSSSIHAVSWAANGRLLACAGHDGTVRLWETASGLLTQTCRGNTDFFIFGVAWSPDNKVVAASAEDEKVYLWEADSGRSLGFSPLQRGQKNQIYAVCFSPDGTTLATAGKDKVIQLWNAKTGTRSTTALTEHSNPVTALAWSPTSQYLASASEDHTVRLWNPAGTKPGDSRRTLRGHNGPVTCLAWSPDGKFLAAGGEDRTIWIWDAETGKAVQEGLKGHNDGVKALAWSKHNLLASGSYDGSVRLWDPKTGKPLGTVPGYTSAVDSLAFSPDGKTLAAGSHDGVVRLWVAESFRLLGVLLASFNEQGLVLVPDGYYRGTLNVGTQIVFVAQTEHGQRLFSPEEFAAKFGWKNDLERVYLSK